MSDIELFSGKPDLCDPKVFGRIFKQHYAELTIFANRFLNDLQYSEEIVSEVFTFLWERKEDIEFASIRSYLYRAVQNRCLNHIKHKKIENEYIRYLVENDKLENSSTAFVNLYSQKELEVQVNKAIEDLPGRCREIFKMSRFEYLKNKDIAQQLNLSQKTVERQMTIALAKLRKSLVHLLSFYVIMVIS